MTYLWGAWNGVVDFFFPANRKLKEIQLRARSDIEFFKKNASRENYQSFVAEMAILGLASQEDVQEAFKGLWGEG